MVRDSTLSHCSGDEMSRQNAFLISLALLGFPPLDDYIMGMGRRYLSFDTETARITDNESDWRSCRPLGIFCAATLPADADQPRLWHGGTDRSSPKDRMSRKEAAKLVEYLTAQTEAGYTLLTWNGTEFDFDVLAEESHMLAECRCLAISHVDMMFDAFCRLGHSVGLDAAAKGDGSCREIGGHER